MATTESDLKALEEDVLERLGADAGNVEADIEDAASAPDDAEPTEQGITRIAIAMAFPVIGTAIMAGGVFDGVGPRIYGAVAGLLGIALALNVGLIDGQPGLGWLHTKLVIVILLSGYHGWAIGYAKKLAAGEARIPSRKLRMIGEVPALAVILIVILAVVKPF